MIHMKTNVRTHLRKKRHGKAIVRHHRRTIRGRRAKIDISKKMPRMVVRAPNYPFDNTFTVLTPIHQQNLPHPISEDLAKARRAAKSQFRNEKEWNDLVTEEEAKRIYPAFFEGMEPVTYEYVVLGNKKVPAKKKILI